MLPVLIVGAGPTGLTAAIELRRFGLPVRLIDRADHPARWSQALAVQARTLEQLERYGLAKEAVARGRTVRATQLYHDARLLLRVELAQHIPGRFPFVLCLPQNDTEDILTRHLRSLGVEIERGVELTGFAHTASGDGVDAHLDHADGRSEHQTFRFLLGCDGAHSTTRKLSGIPFEGESVAQQFSLGDLVLEGKDLPGEELSVYLHEGGLGLFCLQLPNGLYRVITILPGEESPKESQARPTPAPPTLDDFNADFQRFGFAWKATRADWLSPFRVNERKAARFRERNVFLLGDAAHIHSPAGGQGMNTGIQDAANLAWKLNAVRAGAPDTLLESYDEERGAVARAVLRGSGLALRGAGLRNAALESVRDMLLAHVAGLERVQQLVARIVSETGISYKHSHAVHDVGPHGSLRGGDRMPDAELAGGLRLLASLRDARHLLIAVGMPHNAVPIALRNTVILELQPDQPHWTPELEAALGHMPCVYLVRPDGYIGYRGPAGDMLRAYAAATGLLP